MKDILVQHQKQAWEQAQEALMQIKVTPFGPFNQMQPLYKAYYEAKGAYEMLQKILEQQQREKYMEEHKIPEELKTFFARLLELKKFVKEQAEKCNLRVDEDLIEEIYERLDAIIKEKQ